MKRAIVCTIAAISVMAFAAKAADFPDISVADVKTNIAAKTITLLDANGTASWKKGHIPGAIDFESSKDKLADLLPQDKGTLIVAYCGGPKCMAYKAAASAAEKLGYTNIKHLSAGISGWKDARETMEEGK